MTWAANCAGNRRSPTPQSGDMVIPRPSNQESREPAWNPPVLQAGVGIRTPGTVTTTTTPASSNSHLPALLCLPSSGGTRVDRGGLPPTLFPDQWKPARWHPVLALPPAIMMTPLASHPPVMSFASGRRNPTDGEAILIGDSTTKHIDKDKFMGYRRVQLHRSSRASPLGTQ